MLVECIFGIIARISDSCLDIINFRCLALRVIVGHVLNIIVFGFTTGLSNGLNGKGDLAFFFIILSFIIITFFSVLIFIGIDRKTKYYYHVRSMKQDFSEVLLGNSKMSFVTNLKDSVKAELIISYLFVEILFDILLFIYGFKLSNWSPPDNVFCFIDVVLSSFDLMYNIKSSIRYYRKLIMFFRGHCLKNILIIFLRNCFFKELFQRMIDVCSKKGKNLIFILK